MNKLKFLFSIVTLLLLAACKPGQRADSSSSEAPATNQVVAAAKAKDTNRPNPYYSRTDTTTLDVPDSVWKKILSPAVYAIARNKGTERAFTGEYWNYTGVGTYYCKVCGNPLFKSDAKFASTCGWPSFYEPIRPNSVIYQHDTSHNLDRTEVLCGRCHSHLGHIFNDGPPPTGKRYCMNSEVLDFEESLF